jgi:DNA-binding response OmpR family regulator
MTRPTFLIAEPEPAHAISARKLVMETAKFNVITAHSGKETLELFRKFPNVEGIVVHSELRDVSASQVFDKVKENNKKKLTILLMSGVQRSRTHADYTLPSDEPQDLLNLLRELFGDPR